MTQGGGAATPASPPRLCSGSHFPCPSEVGAQGTFMPSTAPLKRGPAPSHDSPRSPASFPPALCSAWMPETPYVNVDGNWWALLDRRGTAIIRLVVLALAPRSVDDLLAGRRGQQVPVSDQFPQRRVRAAMVRPP